MPQRVLVVGGSSDIARQILLLLARRRLVHVVLCGRDLAAMEEVAGELRRVGVSRAECLSLDLIEPGGLGELAEEATERLGEVDLALFSAGELGSAELEELDAARVSQMVASNFSGQAAIALELAKGLLRQGSGRLVFISSVAGVRVRRANFVYGAAKAGLDSFAIGLSEALRGTGVGVMIVRPGFVRTKMTAGLPAAPFSVGPQEVAAAVLAGLEEGREVVWVPAPLRLVFGLLRLLPQALWRRLPG